MTVRDPRGTLGGERTSAEDRWRRVADQARAGEPVTSAWRTEDDVPARPGGSWRDPVVGPVALSLLAGAWLIVSPWVVGYEDADPWWNPIVVGAAVAVLALGRIAMPTRTAIVSLANAAIGVWLFVSGFWLSESTQAAWNVWILGVIVWVLAMVALASGRPADSFDEPV